MKILKIQAQKFKKAFRSVVLEESRILHLHEELIAKHGLCEGMDVPPEKLEEMERESRRKEALDYAYMLLGYRALSFAAMKDRLKRKGFDPEIIEPVLKDLQFRKLLNDSELAQSLTASRIKTHLLGNERVRQDLVRKGIDKDLADQTVRETAQSAEMPDEEERAYQLILKRIKQIKAIDDRTLFRRLFEHLSRRGFASDTIERALSRYRREGHESDKIEGS